MAYPEVLIPPSVRPTTGMEPQLVDDQTTIFSPRYARGASQRQLWGDPLWGWRLRFDKASGADRSALRRVALEARGKAANIRLTPGVPFRNSATSSYWTELFTNGDLSNSTTGWTGARCTLSVTDRVLRATNDKTAGADNFLFSQAVNTFTQYAPYVIRTFVAAQSRASISKVISEDNAGGSSANLMYTGMLTRAFVPNTASWGSVYPLIADYLTGTETIAGDYIDVGLLSVSRCPLVDNGANGLAQSEQLDNGAWTKTATTITANFTAAPDGASTADAIVETAATSDHHVLQAVSVSSTAQDYCFTVAIKLGAVRGWCKLQVNENTSSTPMSCYFNVSTGAVGTTATGANWSNVRAFTSSLGNGWFQFSIVGKKTNAATSVSPVVFLATADNTSTNYAGNTSAFISAWRPTLAQSSVPVRLTQTTTAAPTGATQSGGRLYVKGLPASVSALLQTGDFVEINGELKQLSASLNSDASGLGLMQFRPGLISAPSDNDPVIVNNPMGRFYFVGDPRIVEHYGVYTDFEFDLLEAMP